MFRPVLAVILAGALYAPLAAQEKSGARDMFFGGLEASGAPAVLTAAGRKGPAPRSAATKSGPASGQPTNTTAPVITAGKKQDRHAVPTINAARAPLGLRYAILKMNGVDTVEVAPSTRFHSGDRIQLRIQANTDGYLYIVSQGSSGAWQVMFPSQSRNQGSNRVKAGDEHTSMFRFDAKPGVEKLFVVLSRQPEQDLDSVIYNLRGGRSDTPAAAPAPVPPREPLMLASNLSVGDPLVSRLRNSYTRDLVLEEVAAPDVAERAVYVVNKTVGPDARVVADIKLAHE